MAFRVPAAVWTTKRRLWVRFETAVDEEYGRWHPCQHTFKPSTLPYTSTAASQLVLCVLQAIKVQLFMAEGRSICPGKAACWLYERGYVSKIRETSANKGIAYQGEKMYVRN
jgi:hypothetical protein